MSSGSQDNSIISTGDSPTIEAIDAVEEPIVAETTPSPLEVLPAESYRVEDGVPEIPEPETEDVAEVVDADNNGIVDPPAETTPAEEPTVQEVLKKEAIDAAIQGGRKLIDDFFGQDKGKPSGKGNGKKKK